MSNFATYKSTQNYIINSFFDVYAMNVLPSPHDLLISKISCHLLAKVGGFFYENQHFFG